MAVKEVHAARNNWFPACLPSSPAMTRELKLTMLSSPPHCLRRSRCQLRQSTRAAATAAATPAVVLVTATIACSAADDDSVMLWGLWRLFVGVWREKNNRSCGQQN